MGEASKSRWFSRDRAEGQPPPENACANEPKPPRVTPPEPESDDDVPDGECFDEESPLKKLLREAYPPLEEPWPPLGEDPRDAHSALEDAAIPGWLAPQFSPGISA